MAIHWSTEIDNVDLVQSRASITFSRTDDVDESAFWTNTYHDAIIETGPQRAALLTQVWGAWLAEKANRENDGTFIGNLEQMANADLDARELL